jgi:isopenicillin N synthase-like dioxygenase
MKTLTGIPKLADPTLHPFEFACQLRQALSSVGAAYIPVSFAREDQHLLDRLKAFFALTDAQKRSLAQQLAAPWQGVFLPLGEEQLGDEQEDYKEVFDLNLEQGTYARWAKPRQARSQSRNQLRSCHIAQNEIRFMTALEAIVHPLFQVFAQFQTSANQVLAAIETAYGQPQNSLVEQHGKNSTLRLLHYPPSPHLTPGAIRLGAHQDYSGITLLWQDTTGGLEILTSEGEWVAVEIPPGYIGVIVGEVMQQWSGNTLHGAPHRVRIANVQQLQNPRYSIAFFCETNADCVVYPGSLLSPSERSSLNNLYNSTEPIVIETFLRQKYNQIMEKVNF